MTTHAVIATPGAQVDAVGIGRDFGSVRALAGVDLTIAAGEIVALLGPSGSGKSTLLRILAGLEQPTTGELRFDGRSQLGVPPHQRDVSMVFQHYALYPHLSALDNLVLALRYGRGMSRAAARARADETLRMLGIAELARRRPAQMSGGQRQRVAIGRALATRARVVLLDEPMSGLDAKLRVELRVEIVDLLRQLGTTAVFVTHDQAEAMAVGDRVAVLNQGAIEQIATPDEIYDLPATRFVATFVGSPPMNVLEGTWAKGRLNGPGFSVAAPSSAVAVGVRPEHLRLVRAGDSPGTSREVPGSSAGPGAPAVSTGEVTGQPAGGAGGRAAGEAAGQAAGGAAGGAGDTAGAAGRAADRAAHGAGPDAPDSGLSLHGQVVVAERLGAERTMFVRSAAGMLGLRVDVSVPVVPDEVVTVTAPASALLCFGADGRSLPVPAARQPS
ncbi:molybdenum ABC transporter ATP-binding protein [Frankia sp. CcI49]|uniref:ABC transporter ATP-binding protein n=1 Tax=Frankia sp. CcI49 TaxID=1745382 RepID=UPI0009780FA9|nr:ABC transporter ATP-binding protein [Frankia sp. CcI49]ONH59595.1 molybdenum ABC transporter ATP-binding protein [Frankia sp. CcI49]